MGVTSRLLHMLLSAPSPLLPLRPSAAVLRRPLPPLSAAALRHSHLLLSLPLPLRTDGRSPFHTRSATRDGHGGPGVGLRQWPQWSAFVDRIVSGGYGEGPSRGPLGGDEDAMEESLEVPADFASAVRACLAFARDRPGLLRSLPKKDIEVVASNVTPFLFKKRWETVQRMEAYLNSNQGSNEEVRTVDLVQYLICYAHDHIFCSQGKVYNTTELDASVCNLLQEIVNLSGLVQESYFTNSTDRRSPSSLAQSSGSTGLAMKGGDWICPKCDFMNFARNMKCLECDEARPRKPLVSGEWECPQCDFFNFGRNITCLRCDCSRPSNSHLQPTTASRGYRDTSNGEEQVLGRNNAINRSLDKILCKTSNISSTGNSSRQITVGTRDEITPEKRAPNFVPFVPLPADAFRTPNDSSRDGPSVSASLHAPTEKPSGIMFSESSESAAGSPSYQESSDSRHRTSELHNSGKSAGQNSYDDFPEIMPMRKGENRFVVSKKKDRSLTSPLYKRQSSMEQANGPNFVPFVPFPPDYFAKKNKQPEDSCVDSKNDMSTDDASSESSQSSVGRLNKTSSPEWMSSSENPQVNHQGGNVVSSGRSWFQDKVDPSALRGGANTSISSENPQVNHQGGNVVFSGRGWFQDKVDPSALRGGANTSISSYNNNNQNAEAESWRTRFSEGPKSRNIGGPWNPVGDRNNDSWTGDGSANSSDYTKGRNYSRTDPSRSSSPIASSSQTNNADGQTNAYPSLGRSNPYPSNAESMVPRLAENKDPREGSSWKSLEGSAVTEPDPLDMSEEAKAQRWFRRVAQITDISELANIPDEDFPQIMPMRKGVNRFVVSKRKTPLERRLTSAQYRRNLPVVSSEPQIDASNQGEN